MGLRHHIALLVGLCMCNLLGDVDVTLDVTTSMMKMCGGLIEVDYAEGFYLDGTLHVEDPVSHFIHAEPATPFGDSV